MPQVAWFPLTVVLMLVACSGKAAPPTKGDGVYRVRGQVIAFEGSAENARAVIAHEAIPNFKDRNGTPGRMSAMTMAFGIAPGVDPKVLVPGSKWALVIEVVWSREPVLRIMSAKPLPNDTKLALAVPSR